MRTREHSDIGPLDLKRTLAVSMTLLVMFGATLLGSIIVSAAMH